MNRLKVSYRLRRRYFQDFRNRHRVATPSATFVRWAGLDRSEAIRRLVELGLKTKK
jgi:hypothetical protein